MKEALRSAKQRHRTSIRLLNNREQNAIAARNFWSDKNAIATEPDAELYNEDK